MQSETSTPSRRKSNYRDDFENSSLAQVLSQRLANMEQQLALLRDDLKNAAGTLKEKDRQIQTLQNRIALAERRRELEEAGEPVDESLKDVSEGVASKSNSKRDVLENEVVTLARKLEEMEKFFGDYGLAWVKEDALDEKDPNNLWIRKSNIHYTPDFDKVFLVVEELNLGNAEPQIVKKGNTAQFKNAQLLHLTLYADGIQLESNPFRKYDSPSVEEFFRDLEDGYFPTELKGNHPEGVIFKVKDKRTMKFADDPDKRPVISGSGKPGDKAPLSPSSPSSLSSLKAMSTKSTASDQSPRGESSRRASSLKRRISSKKTSSIPSKVSGDVKPMDPTGELKEAGGSAAAPASTSAPLDNLVPSSAVSMDPAGKTGSQANNEKPVNGTAVFDTNREPNGKPANADVRGVTDGKGESATGGSPGGGVAPGGSPGGGAAAGGPHVAGTSDVPSPGTGSAAVPLPPSQQETGDGPGFKELFRAHSPSSSSPRLRQPDGSNSASPKDDYGLPRPPFPSKSNTNTDVRPLPLGPPSKQFDNFLFPKTTETQTSLTLIPGVPPTAAPQAAPPQCPQPTYVTNITYNEAPITIQMTPSELSGKKNTGMGVSAPSAVQEGTICPTHHSHPCNCVRIPCGTFPSSDRLNDGQLGSVRLAKFPAETEYREKFTESAINNKNVLDFKKKSQQSRSPSPHPVPRQPAATLLVGPDEAPIPPDPLPPINIDPNVKWEHFTFLGHPKRQPAVETPATEKGPTPKRKSSPQVVQLNEKTSDRMIAVRMRTASGNKECIAHVYPDEPVNKLWSLLKLNSNDHSMASSATPHVPLKSGSIGDLHKGDELTLIISKNKGSADARINSSKSPGSRGPSERRSADEKPLVKSREEVSSVSKDGSHGTNVSVSIDSHSSLSGRSKSSSVQASADKKEAKSKKPSQEFGGSVKEPSKSLKQKKSPKGSKNSIIESRLSGELEDSRHSKLNSEGSKKSIGKKEPVVGARPKKAPSYQSAFPPEITPKSRAESLSKHLSGSSLHKTSFKESLRKLEVINEMEPSSSGTPGELISNATIKRSEQIDEEGIQPVMRSPGKKGSNNSAEGLSTFVLPTDSPQHGVGAEPLVGAPSRQVTAKLPSQQDAVKQPSLRDADEQPLLLDAAEQPSTQDLAKQPSLRDPAKQPSLQSAAKQLPLQDAAKQTLPHDGSEDIVEYPLGRTDSAGHNSKSRIPDNGPQEATAAAVVANGDVLHPQEDAPSAGSKLQGLEPLPHPPADSSNPTVGHARRSGEIPTADKSPGEPTTSSPPVQETKDIHSEMKTIVTSAILGIGSGTRLEDIAAKNNDLPKPEAVVSEQKRRRSSDGSPKTVVDRENWHPVEQPPAIRMSDLDMSREEHVQHTANNHKTSYSTNDSEQIFERYQHPEAEKDHGLKTEDAPTKENDSKPNGKVEKEKNQNGKKKKGKSDKKKNIEQAKSAEPDGDQAVESMKSVSAASVQSEADNDEADADELKDESNPAV